MKKMKKILLWILTITMLLPFAISFVSAAPIADEDFEDLTTTDLQDPDWIGANSGLVSNGGNIEKAPDAIRYETTPTKTKALTSRSTGKVDSGILTITENLPEATREVSFDLYANSVMYKGFYLSFGNSVDGKMTESFALNVQNPALSSNTDIAAAFKDRILLAYVGNGTQGSSFTGSYPEVPKANMPGGDYLKYNEWYHFTILLTEGSSTVALYINDSFVMDIPASNASIKQINAIRVQATAGGDKKKNDICIDNISLKAAYTNTPYFYEDFEDYAFGSAPASLWVKVNNTSNDPLTIAEFDAPKKKVETTKALGSVKTGGIDSAVLTLTENLPELTKEISFDVYAEDCSYKGFYMDFRNKTDSTITSAFGLDFQLPSAKNDGKNASYGNTLILSYSGSGGTAPSFAPSYPAVAKTAMPNGEYMRLGEWHNIKVVMTEGASTAELYVDGYKVADIPFNGSVKCINNVWIQKMSNDAEGTNYIFIDNFKFVGAESDGTASATPYYFNDFESYSVGYAPADTWPINASGNSLLSVKEIPVANKAIVISRPASSSINTSVEIKENLPTFTNEVSFAAKIESGSTKGWGFDLMANGKLKVRLNFADPSFSSDKDEYVGKQIVHCYDPTNKVAIEPAYFSDKTNRDPRIIPIKVLEPSQWYTFTLKFTEGSNRVVLYINGKLVSETVYDCVPTEKVIDKILIQHMTGNTGEFAYVDNIQLYGDYSSIPYYSNDFESETIGSALTGMTNNNVRPLFVAGTTHVSEFAQSIAVEGTNAYKVYQNGGGQTITYRTFKDTEVLTVSFDYLATELSSTSGSYISLSSGITGKGTWLNSIRIYRQNASDTNPSIVDGSGNKLANIELGVWYNMKFEYANGVAKFYLDGEHIGNIVSENTSITTRNGIFFGTTSSTSSKDTYYIDNLKFIGAEGFEMNDTPIEFTDNFDSEPAGYIYSGSGSHTISDGKLTLAGAIVAKRSVDLTRSGKFGFKFVADKLDGITVTLYQENTAAVVIKLEEDGTILCKRDDKWLEISDPGKLEAGKSYDFSLDLAPDRNSNYFNVRVNDVITATALYLNKFSYISSIEIAIPAGSTANIDSLYVLESDGVIQMPERVESSPEIYLPMVIDGAKPMYLMGDSSPLSSSLNYVSESEKLMLDVNNTSIGVDLGSVQPVNAIRITGIAEIARPLSHNYYSVYQSDDNQNWIQVKGFSMNHFTENGVSVALFEVTGVEARYLKVRCKGTANKFEIADIRAEVRLTRQWKMAGYAMFALDDTNPVYTPMTRELYDKAITVTKGDSVGINFGLNSHVEAIELVGSGLSTLDKSAFELYQSSDNEKYTLIENVTLSRDTRDGKEVYRLTFPDTVCGYLKLHAAADMTVELADLYDGLCAYSSVEVDSGYSNGSWNVNARGGEGDYYTMPDGTLVMIYTGYPDNGVHSDYSDNVLKAIQSTDGGYTWGSSWITLKKQDGNTNLMCASYHYMANGDLAVLYIEKLPGEDAHVLIRRSQDYGRSWSDPVCITEEPFGYSILSSAVNGWHLSNGRFVVAINYNFASSDAHGSDRAVSYMAYSDDDGYTWHKSSNFVTLPNSSVEPVIAELENGNLIMTMRTRKENSIYQSISTDNGITWAQPVRVENMNTPSSTNSVHTHPSTGDLMLVWNDEVYDPNSKDSGNGNRDPLCIAISTDSGLTYKNQRNLVDGGGTWACIRFFGRSMQLQFSNQLKVIDIAEMYYAREGSKTVADLPVAATPTATYENGWLNGVSATMMYSLDGGATWTFCGGSSVQIGEVSGDIMVKDIGTHEYAPSGVQTVGTTTVLASDLGIVPGNVSKTALNSLIAMASEGSYTFKFDSGVYVFPKTIVLPSNTTIMGDADTVFMLDKGASGKAASPAVISIGNQIDNVRITSLTVKGYNETTYCPTKSANHIGISISQALRVNIDHVNVVGFADSGIKAEHMGYVFYSDTLNYDQRQAYFKNLQLSDCRIEKCYYGLNLGYRAEYCQITNLAAGYNNIGCVNSGGNNSFVNCLFNKNNTGYYLLCTNMSNPGHGGATGCSFNHNKTNALIIEGNQIGFTFTGCQFFDGKIKQTNSCGTIFSACILGSVKLEASGSAGSGIFTACFFQTDRDTILAGNNGVFTVADCIDVPAAATALASEQTAEPQMMRLSAASVSETTRIYSGSTTLMASDFGVVAGNVSESALNALIAKANEGGYTFKFDSGVYVFPKTIILPSNTTIIGDAGTVFMLAESASGAVINIGSLVDNVRISNLTLKGHNTTAYPAYKANSIGISMSSALKVSIDRVNVIGFTEAGIKATSMGLNFWDNTKTDDQKQAYFKSLQLTDCHLEKNYVGLNLGYHAEYCQITNASMGYNNIGCVNSGGNNSFANCVFNNNNVGFSLDCGAAMRNHGHGGASGCTFVKNNNTAIAIKENSLGYTFNGCNIQGKIVCTDSTGIIFNASVIDSSLEASGNAGSGIFYGCRIKNESTLLSGADGIFTVSKCIGTDNATTVPVATYEITTNSPVSGGTVEVSDLGIVPGVVSNEALDALVAFAANGGYTLKFDSGVYEFGKTLAIPSNTAVVGCADTVFKLTGSKVGKIPVIIVEGVDNVRLESFTVLGELTKNYIADSIYSSSGSVGISISNSLRVSLENITVKNFQEAAVKIANVGLNGYCETVQISNCRVENSYYGLWLAENANFCQITGLSAGYCSAGCLDSGANNSFANCVFNKNRVGFYVYHTNFPNAGAGTIVNSCFNHNDNYGLRIDDCTSGYSFSGCQFFSPAILHRRSANIVIGSSILGSVVIDAQNSAQNSCMLVDSFFQTNKTAILANNKNVYTVVDCIEVTAQ